MLSATRKHPGLGSPRCAMSILEAKIRPSWFGIALFLCECSTPRPARAEKDASSTKLECVEATKFLEVLWWLVPTMNCWEGGKSKKRAEGRRRAEEGQKQPSGDQQNHLVTRFRDTTTINRLEIHSKRSIGDCPTFGRRLCLYH